MPVNTREAAQLWRDLAEVVKHSLTGDFQSDRFGHGMHGELIANATAMEAQADAEDAKVLAGYVAVMDARVLRNVQTAIALLDTETKKD